MTHRETVVFAQAIAASALGHPFDEICERPLPPIGWGDPENLCALAGVVVKYTTQAEAVRKHAIPALRGLAKQRCKKSNCGTACLCDSCHARKALETLDPTWRP